MRSTHPYRSVTTGVAQSVALPGAEVWAASAEGAGGFGLRRTDRLPWPAAIAVILGLSAALWFGIFRVVDLAFG